MGSNSRTNLPCDIDLVYGRPYEEPKRGCVYCGGTKVRRTCPVRARRAGHKGAGLNFLKIGLLIGGILAIAGSGAVIYFV